MEWLTALLGMFGGLFGGIGNLLSGNKNREAMLQATRETNEANLQAVRETNAANVEQANLAYERSKPVQQLSNLMETGLSRQGALNIMSGVNGGVYNAPTLQTAQHQSAQLNYDDISRAFEQLGNIPSNVMQSRLQQQQIERVDEEMRLQREKFELERKALEERLQRERDDELRKQYGQNVVEMTDKLSAKIDELVAKYGVKYADLRNEDDLVDKLKLNDEPLWRAAPAAARQNAVDSARQRNADWLALEDNERKKVLADDSHRMSLIDYAINQADLNERQQMLVHKLALLANQVTLSNYEINKANYEKVLRDVGFENRKEAEEAISAAELLNAGTQRNKARFYNVRSDSNAAHVGYAIEWLIDKISPFKGLLNSK